jgi:hypothetical protein
MSNVEVLHYSKFGVRYCFHPTFKGFSTLNVEVLHHSKFGIRCSILFLLNKPPVFEHWTNIRIVAGEIAEHFAKIFCIAAR